MQDGKPKRTSARIRHLFIGATLIVWLAAVVAYSLWTNRPELDINHELELGISVLALATGLSSLLLVGRRRLQLGLGIVVCLVGFGFILELAQGYFVDAHRTEPGDFAIIAVASIVGVGLVAGLASLVGSAWTQRIVAIFLVIAATGTIVVPGVQTPAFQQWWACDRPGLNPSGGPALSITVADNQVVAEMSGKSANSVATGAEVGGQPGAISFSGAGNVSIAETRPLLCSLASTSAFTLQIDVRTTDLDQQGPARLFTVSDGTEYNQIYLQVGQQADALSVRLQTDPGWYEELSVDSVFTDTEWHTLDIVFNSGTLFAYRDGVAIGQQPTDRPQLDGWDHTWPVTLGNEVTGDRAFSGEIRKVLLESDTATLTE